MEDGSEDWEEDFWSETGNVGVEAMQVEGVQGSLHQFPSKEDQSLIRFRNRPGIVGLKT